MSAEDKKIKMKYFCKETHVKSLKHWFHVAFSQLSQCFLWSHTNWDSSLVSHTLSDSTRMSFYKYTFTKLKKKKKKKNIFVT